MADEVLKIVFEEGGSAAGGPSVGPRRSGAGEEFNPVLEAQRMLEQQQRKQLIQKHANLLQYGNAEGPEKPEVVFDPAARARELIAEREKRKAIQEEINLHDYGDRRGAPPEPEAVFDPAAEARKVLERQERAKQVHAELTKLRGPESPDVRGMIGSGVQAAGQLGAQAGIPGAGVVSGLGGAIGAAGPAAATLAVAAAAIATVRMIDSKVRQVADDAGRFSVEAQTANAMAEIRRVQGDLRRSQEVGPSLARLVDAESRLDESIRDLFTSPEWLEFKAQVTESLIELVKIVGPILGWMSKAAPDVLKVMFPKVAMAVDILGHIKTNTDPAELRDTGDVFMTQFLNQDFGRLGDGRDEVTESSRRLLAEQVSI